MGRCFQNRQLLSVNANLIAALPSFLVLTYLFSNFFDQKESFAASLAGAMPRPTV